MHDGITAEPTICTQPPPGGMHTGQPHKMCTVPLSQLEQLHEEMLDRQPLVPSELPLDGWIAVSCFRTAQCQLPGPVYLEP